MKRHFYFLPSIIGVFAALALPEIGCAPQISPRGTASIPAFVLTVPSLPDGATIPPAQVYDQSGCKGSNQSPALHWSGAPAATKSFAVTVFDPDAGKGKGWWHWAAYNLPAGSTDLAAGAGNANGHELPAGTAQATNDFGALGYGGPCPPPGDAPHHYVLTVYALDAATLPVSASPTPTEIAGALPSHTLAKATLTLRYGR